jgi:ABC-type multidrug transport system fused ATPase/permease subunit
LVCYELYIVFGGGYGMKMLLVLEILLFLAVMGFIYYIGGILGVLICFLVPLFIVSIVDLKGGVIKHIKRWNSWRKYNRNSKLHKLLVLFNMIHSPTFEAFDTIDTKVAELTNRYDYVKVSIKDCKGDCDSCDDTDCQNTPDEEATE